MVRFPECFTEGQLNINKMLSANLLQDDEVVFISIDDNEMDNLTKYEMRL